MADATRKLIGANVSTGRLEFARITEIRTSVGQQTCKGIAEFRFLTKGGVRSNSNSVEGLATMTAWSLGFQEVEPGVWIIYRISHVSIPAGVLALPAGVKPSDESHVGLNDAIGVPRSDSHSFPRNHGSTMSNLSFRVESLQFDTCLLNSKLPVTARCLLLVRADHAAISVCRITMSPMRRSDRHWLVGQLSSHSATLSQLPCLGVKTKFIPRCQ